MYEITKDFAFSASHVLHGLPEGHQCGRLHGHNYVVRVALTGKVLSLGMLVDYGDLKPFGKHLDDTYDHRHLNDLGPFVARNPTAENMARALYDALLDFVPIPEGVRVAVGVSETPKTWAWYRP